MCIVWTDVQKFHTESITDFSFGQNSSLGKAANVLPYSKFNRMPENVHTARTKSFFFPDFRGIINNSSFFHSLQIHLSVVRP